MLWTVVLEDSFKSFGLPGDPSSPSWRKSVLNIHWKEWNWSSYLLTTWCKELTHWKRPWCWGLKAGGEGDSRGWDGWMASLMRWTWVWVGSGSWWWSGKPGMLQSMGVTKSQTWLSDWTELKVKKTKRKKKRERDKLNNKKIKERLGNLH